MMYIYALILGIVQAITEFLPISSSGHLVVLHEFLQFNLGDNVAFDVALHFGTFFAILIYFRADVKKYIVALLNVFRKKAVVDQMDLKTVLNIFYATIPAVILGVLFNDMIENSLRSPWVIVITLTVGAILFFLIEKFAKKTREYTGLGFGRSLYIGLAQALALIPGLSRSGMTIVAGMSLKLKREDAAKFSFLIGLPVMFAAGSYKLLSFDWAVITNSERGMFFIGFLVSGVLGFFVIKFLLGYLKNHSLRVFAWYRLGLAAVLLVLLLWR